MILLKMLCQMSKRVDFICDTYQTPSIKDAERTLRKEADHTDTVYVITGAQQTRPKNWQEALKWSSFKSVTATKLWMGLYSRKMYKVYIANMKKLIHPSFFS